jgi:iron complex transport system ATP-binding protein
MALEVRNLGVTMGGRPLLEEVAFRADPGRFTCLVGPNGAGKSTLLRSLAQMLPHSGEVWLGGEALRGLSRPELARRVAYLPQFTETPLLTVLETLELGRRARAGTRLYASDRRALDGLISRFGLESYLMRPLAQLSGGERQKVMIAATLAQEPALLLLDEPISHLDPKNQLEVLRAVAEATRDAQIVTLVVLHDVQQALHFGDRLLMLRDGKVQHHLERNGVDSVHLEALYDVPVKLFWQEGHPFLFFGHGHGRGASEHHHLGR